MEATDERDVGGCRDHVSAEQEDSATEMIAIRAAWLIDSDTCAAKCLVGRENQLCRFLSNMILMIAAEKKACVLTTLSVLWALGKADSTDELAVSHRKRFPYILPLVGNWNIRQEATWGTSQHQRPVTDVSSLVVWFSRFSEAVGDTAAILQMRAEIQDGKRVFVQEYSQTFFLPAAFSWKRLYDEAVLSATDDEQIEFKLPSERVFQATLQKNCPRIRVRSVDPDVCDICSTYVDLMALNPLSMSAEPLGEHTLAAKTIRSDYDKDHRTAREQAHGERVYLCMGFSDDHAIPSTPSSQTQWPRHMLISTSLFGVLNLATKTHDVFSYTELRGGRAANEVVAMLSRVLGMPGAACVARDLTLYAKACNGFEDMQVIKFLLLLVHSGLLRSAQYKLATKGHTATAHDTAMKQVSMPLASRPCWTLDHVQTAVKAASPRIQLHDLEPDANAFQDFSGVLDLGYKRIRHRHAYSSFAMHHDDPGVVRCKGGDKTDQYDLRKPGKGGTVSSATFKL